MHARILGNLLLFLGAICCNQPQGGVWRYVEVEGELLLGSRAVFSVFQLCQCLKFSIYCCNYKIVHVKWPGTGYQVSMWLVKWKLLLFQHKGEQSSADSWAIKFPLNCQLICATMALACCLCNQHQNRKRLSCNSVWWNDGKAELLVIEQWNLSVAKTFKICMQWTRYTKCMYAMCKAWTLKCMANYLQMYCCVHQLFPCDSCCVVSSRTDEQWQVFTLGHHLVAPVSRL